MTTSPMQATLKDPKYGLLPGDLVAGTVKLAGPIHTYVSLGTGFGSIKTEELPKNERTAAHDFIFRVKSNKIGTLPVLTINSLGISDEERDRLLAKWREDKKALNVDSANNSTEEAVKKPNKLTIPIKSGHATLHIGDYVIGYVTGNKEYGVFVEVGNRKGLVHINYLPEYDCPWDFQNDQPLLLKIIDIRPDGKLSLDLKNVPIDQYELAVSDVRNINYLKDPLDEPVENYCPQEKTPKIKEKTDQNIQVLKPTTNDYSIKHHGRYIADAFHRKVLMGDFVVGIIDTPTECGISVWIGAEKHYIEKPFLRTQTDLIKIFYPAQPILLRCTGINPHKKRYFSQKNINDKTFNSTVKFLKESGILRQAILSYKSAKIKANLTLSNRISQKYTTSIADSSESLINEKDELVQSPKPLEVSSVQTPAVSFIETPNKRPIPRNRNKSSPKPNVQYNLINLIKKEDELTKGCYVLAKLKKHLWYGAEIEFDSKDGVLFANNGTDLQDYSDSSYVLLRYLEKTESGKNIFTLSHTDILEREPFEKLAMKPMNVLFIGPTGVGKSSIINALLCTGTASLLDLTTVGHGFMTCTNEINGWNYKNLTLWDSPGLGESPESDKKTISLLNEWIDSNTDKETILVLVYDAYSRDCHSTFSILENLTKKLPMVHVINRVDMLLRGQYWDDVLNVPKKETQSSINEKLQSIKQRINLENKYKHKIIEVCAGYENEFETRKPYNIDKLVDVISSLTKQ